MDFRLDLCFEPFDFVFFKGEKGISKERWWVQKVRKKDKVHRRKLKQKLNHEERKITLKGKGITEKGNRRDTKHSAKVKGEYRGKERKQ